MTTPHSDDAGRARGPGSPGRAGGAPPAAAGATGVDMLDPTRIGARISERDHRRSGLDPLLQVRASDVEPYTGLGYLSKLFRLIAVLLLVLLVAEVALGLYAEGSEALRTLLTEASRMVVVAGVLWGAGDLATLLIDIGHDVRATRILLGRQVTHHLDQHHPRGAAADPQLGALAMTDRGGERDGDRSERESPRPASRDR